MGKLVNGLSNVFIDYCRKRSAQQLSKQWKKDSDESKAIMRSHRPRQPASNNLMIINNTTNNYYGISNGLDELQKRQFIISPYK